MVRRRLGLFRGNRYAATRVMLLVKEHHRLGSELALLGERAGERGAQIRASLDVAWDHLTHRRPDPLVGAAYLALADQSLVWLLPRPRLVSRGTVVLATLDASPDPAAQEAGRRLRKCLDNAEDDDAVRAALCAAVELVHTAGESQTIADDLQVRRLEHLFFYAAGILLLLCAAVPLAAPDALFTAWPPAPAGGRTGALLVVTGAVVVMGAAGGVLSGLLQTRHARSSLMTYRTSTLNLALRPLVGALVALVITVLAGWRALPAVEGDDPGLLLLAAFAAGFSERFFLKLLKVPQGGVDEPARPARPREAP